jgi:hypothetical protein
MSAIESTILQLELMTQRYQEVSKIVETLERQLKEAALLLDNAQYDRDLWRQSSENWKLQWEKELALVKYFKAENEKLKDLLRKWEEAKEDQAC